MISYITEAFKGLWSRPKPRKRYNVGISVADMVLSDGTIVPITLVGRIDRFFGEVTVTTAKYRMDRLFYHEWILGDNGVNYNRAFVHSYQAEHREYWLEE